MIVYEPQADGGYKEVWGKLDTGAGSGAVAWLPVTMNGDGKTQIVQLWDHNGRLGMIVYGPRPDGSSRRHGEAVTWAKAPARWRGYRCDER
jgi:hypothetical protein